MSPQTSSSVPPKASEFYIVSAGYSDTGLWHHSVLEVKPDGADMLVRYIRIGPIGGDCGNAPVIGAAATRLQDTSFDALTGGVNLCAVDSRSLSRTIRAFSRIGRMSVFAADRYTLVAKCGADTRVIRLPEAWKLDMPRLKRKLSGTAALWTLENAVGTRAFGPFPFVDVVPPEMVAKLQPPDEAILAEVKSGRFDAGLAPPSFKDDAAASRPMSQTPVFSVKLANADHFRFERYVNPQYPALARQARISGTVEFEVTSNPITGEMEQITVLFGHPLLIPAVKESAQQWRFLPSPDIAPRPTRVALEFVFHCP